MQEQDLFDALSKHIVKQSFPKLLNMTIEAATEGKCTVMLPAKPEIMRTIGIYNGGALLALADIAAGYAVATLNKGANVVVTTDLHTNFLKKADGEKVRAEAEVIKDGKTISVVRVNIFDCHPEGDALCMIATFSYMKISE